MKTAILIIIAAGFVCPPVLGQSANVDQSIPAGLHDGAQFRTAQGGEGSICSLPADVGPCDGVCPRFFYDVCTGQCELFDYGCCDGNANNFETLEECEAACPPEDDTCFLPAEVGPCEGLCRRFFYNVCTGECESFIYGCCEGNANNFLTMEDCQATCPVANECLQADLDDDGAVGAADLAILLGNWGPCAPPCEPEGEPPGCPESCAPGAHAETCSADFGGGNCRVDPFDLAFLLGVWGLCPQ